MSHFETKPRRSAVNESTTWQGTKLGELGQVVSGLTYSPDDVCDEQGVLVLRSSNVQAGQIVFDDNVFVNVKEGDFNPVKKGDILICVRNGSKSLIGKCAVIPAAAEGLAFGAFMAVFRSKHNDYLHHLFSTDLFKREIHRNLGATINSINGSDLKKFTLPLPPLAEQKAIAHVLGLVDKAIELNNKVIAQKELRKKWLMQNLLTGKKRLKGFTGEWREIRIADLLKKVFRYAEWNDEHVYKLVSIGRRYRGLFERGEFYGHQIEVKKIKSVQQNDFLISKRQVSHGAWGIVRKHFHDWKVSDEYDCLTLLNAEKLNMEFWDWYCKQPLMTHYAYLASNGVHIEKLIFDYNSFKKRSVLLPTLEEQKAVAAFLQCAEKEIELLNAKTETLREQKKGMMQQLLTGKTRLKIEDVSI